MKQFWYLHSQNVRIINISLNFILKSPPLLALQIFLQLQYHTKTKHKNRRQKQKMLIVNREMDSVQFTITSMHFDNYLQTKTTQPPQFPYNKFHYPTAQNNIQNNSFRPSTTSHNLPFNKTPLSYLQTRQESSKSTVSSNYLTNDLKNPNLEHKPMHPIPSQIKSQVTANHSYISLAPNGQKTHEQKKYINLSPAKPAGRMTTGLPPQQTPKIQPRRSQSVNDPRLKDAAQNFNAPWFRQSVGVAGSSKNINHLSPFQLNFSNIKVFSDKNNSFCDRKQPSQNVNYFKTNDNQWSTNSNLLYTNRGSHYEQGKIEKPYLDLEKQRKMNQIITDSNVTSNESLYKQSSVSLSNNETNRQGNKEDMSKNLTAKAISYVQKDIEKLKNASKRVDQVYHNQISRNYYFNKFLEEKGIKSPEQDKKFELKETKDSKELEKRISSLQKELQQKKNEITDKNKELVDQTKTILDKNKVIDSVSIQLKQYKAKLQNKQKQLKDNEKQILELKDKCELMIVLRKNQQLFYQRIVQYNKKQQTENGLLQKVRKDNEKMKQQLRNIEQLNKKLMTKITKYEQTIGLVQENNKRYLFELNETRQELRIKETQLIINKARLQNQKDIVREQQSTIQQLKKQLKNKENTSQKNILSSQQTNKSAQIRNNEQQILKLTNKINDLQYKSMELSMLLLNNKVYNHETVVLKIIQMKQSFKISQTLRQKEQQRVQEFHLLRMHQEYVQKKFNELSRQCKKISGKLGVVTNQAQLGWKMLTETNNEVVLLNLKCLNENYKQQAEQIQ